MNIQKIYNEPTINYSEPEAARVRVDGITGRIDATRLLKCNWENRLELVRQLLGWIEVVGNNLNCYSPHRFPLKGLELCIARSASWDRYLGGVNKDVTQSGETLQKRVASFEFAQIEVNYSTHVEGQPESGEIWRRENIRGCAEMMMMPNNAMLGWKTGETYTPIEGDEIPGYLMHRTEWSYTRKIPGNPPTALLDLTNYVNSTALISPTYGYCFQPETLKFLTPQFNVERDIKGNVITELSLTYHHQKEGWNKFPRQVGGGIIFQSLYELTDKTLFRPFPTYDFRGWII